MRTAYRLGVLIAQCNGSTIVSLHQILWRACLVVACSTALEPFRHHARRPASRFALHNTSARSVVASADPAILSIARSRSSFFHRSPFPLTFSGRGHKAPTLPRKLSTDVSPTYAAASRATISGGQAATSASSMLVRATMRVLATSRPHSLLGRFRRMGRCDFIKIRCAGSSCLNC